jgi:hypothetical protein
MSKLTIKNGVAYRKDGTVYGFVMEPGMIAVDSRSAPGSSGSNGAMSRAADRIAQEVRENFDPSAVRRVDPKPEEELSRIGRLMANQEKEDQ